MSIIMSERDITCEAWYEYIIKTEKDSQACTNTVSCVGYITVLCLTAQTLTVL